MIVVKDYHINIFWSDKDEGYTVDLKVCRAFGNAPHPALAEIRQAKQARLAPARQRAIA